MSDLESSPAAAAASDAAAIKLDDSLYQLIQQLRNGSIERPAAISLLEKARANVQRRLREIAKAKK
jgi:hypothetical protein